MEVVEPGMACVTMQRLKAWGVPCDLPKLSPYFLGLHLLWHIDIVRPAVDETLWRLYVIEPQEDMKRVSKSKNTGAMTLFRRT